MRETARAKQAYADYLAMGPGRSLEKLLDRYRSHPSPPTLQIATLKNWSRHFGWQDRLHAEAERAAREAEEREAEYRRQIMETRFGLAHKRVEALKLLADRMLDELLSDRLWVTEPKSVGSGPNAQIVDVERFNAAEVEQFRATLDDIAKELGHRRQRHEHKVDLEVQRELEGALDRLRSNLDPEMYKLILNVLAG